MTDGVSPPAPPRFFLAAWLAGAPRRQRLIWAEAFCKWLHLPLPSLPYALQLGEGQHFELHRGAWMSVLVPMIVFSQFVDVLIAQGAIHVIAQGPQRLALHALLLFGSLWAVVWAVSLRSATRQVAHVLGSHTLTLAVGFKHLCRVPLTAIADVRVIDRRAADWLDACKLRLRDVTVLTPLDKPTLLIELRPALGGAWWVRNGVQRPLKRWIAVYVDQPEVMRTAVASALPPAATSTI